MLFSQHRTSSIISSILAKYEKPKIAAASAAITPVTSVQPTEARSITTLSTPRNTAEGQSELSSSITEIPIVPIPASTPSTVVPTVAPQIPTT